MPLAKSYRNYVSVTTFTCGISNLRLYLRGKRLAFTMETSARQAVFTDLQKGFFWNLTNHQ